MKRQFPLLIGAFALALLLGVLLRGLAGWPVESDRPATADAPPAPGLAFEGTVHMVGAGTPALWVVGDYPVTVISTTIVITNGLAAQPGIWARVEALKQATLQATTIELQPAPTSDLYDRIRAIDAGRGVWQVGNTLVSVGPETVVIGSAPAVDHWAQVHGTLSGLGIDASRIVVVSADGEAIYQGLLRAMNGSVWQIDQKSAQPLLSPAARRPSAARCRRAARRLGRTGWPQRTSGYLKMRVLRFALWAGCSASTARRRPISGASI